MTGKVQIRPGDAAGIAAAAELLRQGGLVALPTETVYGLAARADSSQAVAAIYRAKGRPDFNPLIVHVPDHAAAERLAQFDSFAETAAHAAQYPVKLLLTYVEERDGVPHICIPDGHGYPVVAEAMTSAMRG